MEWHGKGKRMEWLREAEKLGKRKWRGWGA
jgi:hypothetical protein